ncbi:uridine permease [Cryptococcus neoformans C23]|uniref:Uridine permease n=1 Tax=Cryptococcus neoformans (strain H99 / ATCC 208821 / CBS 10515 / FGSC 9487) TaxID=235443 RepID=J9VWU6_CRYN9|nr:uridine permease [Cryptococcus neoformans var. grubii H99]AUB28918.1 uridine permease [Cryptococcus neoformans var. grubii]OWZ26490.1 uridine permease [Cryptococcus neoformans var. grubii AD2-60a]OWZ38542.1 uridine permease [Cryptococcus neoformans var. grubii C23]AFR98733.1 uridine permease [Cryptococcus neoformans var. grubii H99]OXH22239.1 uridine permease [Cryptococcus neoformans var. grubii]|eukprot:XP_012053530.1 uridine permease [Cryptococcus neoformans var. grubii H99]
MPIRLRMPKLVVEGSKGREAALENDDLLPIPLERRTWNFTTFSIFWFSAVGTVANWLSGGTFLSYGITVWDGILCNFFGYLLISFFMVINGCAGSVYHIGFPVYCRSSFGVFGSFWPVFNRALSACVWNGVNTVTGGQCIYIFLHSIFPSIAHLPNHMPSTSGMTSAQMCGFFLFWFFTGCALFLSVPKWKILIHAKLIAYFLSCVGMLALALTTSKGVGNTLTAGPTAHGSERAWLIVRFTLLSAAGCSTFASNASDWQRNATHKRDPIFGQIFGFPMSNFITTLCGLIVAASSEKAYGTLIWNPLTYLDRILTENYVAKTRAGTAIISIGFAYSALFSCVFENVLPAGNDISSLAPKYLSMKRAFAICMIITVVLLFLKYLLGSAGIFVTFISSYQIFLFSIVGVLLVDYYVVSKGRLDLTWMYTADKKGPYYYTFGINWRAIFAYCIGAGVNFAGFLNNMGVKGFSTGVIRSFYFAFITTGCASGLSYYLLAKFFPQENYRRFKGLRFREWTEEEVELYVQSAPWRILGTAPPKVGEDGVPIMPGNRRSSEDVEDMGEKKVGTTQTTILEV